MAVERTLSTDIRDRPDDLVVVPSPVADALVDEPRDTSPRDPQNAAGGCVICDDPVDAPGVCCSSPCAGEAQRQVRLNAVEIRRLEIRAEPEARRELAERNGRLMSALLRWRPDAEESPTA